MVCEEGGVKIYVASSWRCEYQPRVVDSLQDAGHEVYDFRHPHPNDYGFAWGDIAGEWLDWEPAQYCQALTHPIANAGFSSDFEGMKWADACVMVLPCGRSAHLEAGWFVGNGKPLFILILEKCEPELMYKMATSINLSISELLEKLETKQ